MPHTFISTAERNGEREGGIKSEKERKRSEREEEKRETAG